MRIKHLILPFLVFFLGACASLQGPENNTNFADVNNLEEFSGTYRNLGQGGIDNSENYLSRLIWSQVEIKDHAAIQTISIQIASKNEMRIDAISAGKTVQKQLLTEGEDFVFTDGKITLLRPSSDVSGMQTKQSQTKTAIGLDAEGYEKYHRIGAAAGAMLLAFPVAIVDNNNLRYERVE